MFNLLPPRHISTLPQSGHRSDLKVIALLDHLSCMTQRHPADLGKARHHLGWGGGAIVDGTFVNHAISKTCLAIC